MLEFLQLKSHELGHVCPSCSKNDGMFALNGKCNECGHPIPQKSKEKSFLFSLEIITEFLRNGGKNDPSVTSEMLKSTNDFLVQNINEVRNHNRLPSNNNLIMIQSMLNSGAKVGYNEIGGAITMKGKDSKLTILEDPKGYILSNVKALGGLILAIQYISNIPVKNEVSFSSSNKNTNKNQNPTKKGCLSILLVFILVSSFITIYFSI